MKCLFSIIIPHKNIPHLLQRCLDSIPYREDVHIIIVDDNSDAKIVDFSNFPGLKDCRCEVIFTKEGKGAGYARNVALSKVDSKWVLFSDSDDYFSQGFGTFLDAYKDSDADLVFYENQTIDNDSGLYLDKDLMVKDYAAKSNKENNYDPLRFMTHAPWTKMVNMDLIKNNNIKFQEIRAANDVWFATQVGYYANKIEVSNMKVYIRTVRQGSLFYSFKAENLLARIDAGYKVNKFLKKVDKLEYYAETWGYFMDLRKISWLLFVKNIIPYVVKNPSSLLKKRIICEIKKYVK